MDEFNDLEVCACVAYPRMGLDAAMKGLAETPRNHPPEVESQGRVFSGFEAFGSVERAIHLIGKTWDPGRTIKVGFLDGSIAQRAKVKKHAAEWLLYANLRFDFDSPNPDVRVSFRGTGSWSMIGTDCLMIPSGPTVNFGWVTDSSAEDSDRAVIVHEFGHMLGLGHEQSSPVNDIKWNRPVALAWYERTQGWSAQMVNDNVFAVFDPASVVSTSYDRASIMQYPVPAELTLNGNGIGWNSDLSPLDKQHVHEMYPGVAVGPPPAPPVKPPPPNLNLPHVTLNGQAAHVSVPAPGKPARFRFEAPAENVYELAVAVDHARGRAPLVVIVPDSTGQPLTIGLVHGRGRFRFEAGTYEIDVYNPIAGLTGVAWVKVGTN